MRVLILLLVGLWPALSAAQSPWARSKAGFYTQLSYHVLPEYDEVFGSNDQAAPTPRALTEHTLELYGEYGLTSRSTLVLSVPYRFIHAGATNPDFPSFIFDQQAYPAEGTTGGLGNVALAWRQQLLSSDNVALAATLRVDFPSNKYDAQTGLRTGYDAFSFLPLMSVGMGFDRAYWFAYGGYGFRTGGYTQYFNAGMEGGLKFGPVWVMAFSEWIGPLETGDVAFPLANQYSYMFTDNQGWWSFGLKGIWEVNRFAGVIFSGAGALAAQNVPKSPGLGLGVYFKWQ